MTNEELEEALQSLEQKVLLTYQALNAIRKLMGINEQRIMNLEDFMRRATGAVPNPIVGVPPTD